MKKIISIILLTFAMSGYSQMKKDTAFKYSAGTELMKASNHFYKGFTISLIGAGLAAIPQDDKEMKTYMVITGSVVSLIGAIFMIESHIHLKRAGVILNKNGVGLSININK